MNRWINLLKNKKSIPDEDWLNISDSITFFDRIISLGGTCQVAYQLERLKLRYESYPFDWLVTENTTGLVECIRNRFSDWLLLDNIEELSAVEPYHRNIIDHKYQFEHRHLFPINGTIEENYSYIYKKACNRNERLLKLKNKKLLFVRTNNTIEEANLIYDVLKEAFGKEVYLLIVNHTKNSLIRKIYSSRDNRIMIYEIYDENENTGQRWQGYNKHWDVLLGNNVRCKNQLINIKYDTYFENWYGVEIDEMGHYFRWSSAGKNVIHLEEFLGGTCKLCLFAPFSIKVSLKNTHDELVCEKVCIRDEELVFPINHLTRWVYISTNNCWRPSEEYGTADDRYLGIMIKNIVVDFNIV